MASRKPRIWDGTIVPFEPTEIPACRGVKEFTKAESGYSVRREGALELQREYCAKCPVLVECITNALDHEPYGLRGLTEHQRRDLGGVIAEEWAEYTPNPAAAFEEIAASGIPVTLVKDILAETGTVVPRSRARRRVVA